MRTFVVVGRTARADGGVRLDDLAGTSGRLDVLVRCVRAAFCISHGIRTDVCVHLVLGGGERAVVVRIDGGDAKFIRPDERALATMILKAVERHGGGGADGFVAQRHGISVACGGLDIVLADVRGQAYVLDEGAPDFRGERVQGDAVFFIGDHGGFDDATRTRLAAIGARPVSVGPTSLHSDDVVTLVHGELDRVSSRA